MNADVEKAVERLESWAFRSDEPVSENEEWQTIRHALREGGLGMTDLTDRLRALSRHEHDDYSIGDEAADEIERLRNERDALKQDATMVRARLIDAGVLDPNVDSMFCDAAVRELADERDALRARIDGGVRVGVEKSGNMAMVRCNGLPPEWIGKRVALVLLGDEE